MAILDYVYSGTDSWFDFTTVKPCSDLPADEGSGGFRNITLGADPHLVTPASDLFVQATSGRFTVFFPPGLRPSSDGFRFRFYRQFDPEVIYGYFELQVVRQLSFMGDGGMRMTLAAVHPGGFPHIPFAAPAVMTTVIPDAEFDHGSGNGTFYQIEWVTNGGDPTPLSSDPENPSFPTLQFTFKYHNDSCDIDAGKIALCQLFDLAAIDAVPNEQTFTLVQAMTTYGPALYDRYFPIAQAQDPALLGLATTPAEKEEALALSQAVVFTGLEFKNLFAIRDNNGEDPSAISRGLIQPISPEQWGRRMDGCRGWDYELFGQSELAVALIDEPWSLIDNPPAVIFKQEDWEDQNPPPLAINATIKEETWES